MTKNWTCIHKAYVWICNAMFYLYTNVCLFYFWQLGKSAFMVQCDYLTLIEFNSHFRKNLPDGKVIIIFRRVAVNLNTTNRWLHNEYAHGPSAALSTAWLITNMREREREADRIIREQPLCNDAQSFNGACLTRASFACLPCFWCSVISLWSLWRRTQRDTIVTTVV